MTPALPQHLDLDEQAQGLLGVVVVLRVALIMWSTIVTAVDMAGTTEIRSTPAIVVLLVLVLWTSAFTWVLSNHPQLITRWTFVAIDVGVAALAGASDVFVYPGPHPQSFTSAWPLSGAVVAGILGGAGIGAMTGSLIGVIGAISLVAVADDGLDGRILGSLGTVVLLTIAGMLAGLVTSRLREAELTKARAQIREDMARALHDGVLQTLAVIQRRSDDGELVELARAQERELRVFITTPSQTARTYSAGGRGSITRRFWSQGPRSEHELLSLRLRDVAATQAKRFAISVEVVVVDEPPAPDPMILRAIEGAVSEAIANSARHGAADTVTVFVDSDAEHIECEVRDDGCGFDPATVEHGLGIPGSIEGRMVEVGGSSEISSALGRGTTVRLLAPLMSPTGDGRKDRWRGWRRRS